MKYLLFIFSFAVACMQAQDNPIKNPVISPTQVKVDELIAKKAEYHRLTDGKRDGYRIKIHSSVERAAAESVKTKFNTSFSNIPSDLEYQLPNFVILIGNYRTKLEAFESLKKIQSEFPNAFIVKGKITVE